MINYMKKNSNALHMACRNDLIVAARFQIEIKGDFSKIEGVICVNLSCIFFEEHCIIVSSTKTKYLLEITRTPDISYLRILFCGVTHRLRSISLRSTAEALFISGGMNMNPRERIATILFMEQLKRTKVNHYHGAIYKELVLRKEIKNANEKNAQ